MIKGCLNFIALLVLAFVGVVGFLAWNSSKPDTKSPAQNAPTQHAADVEIKHFDKPATSPEQAKPDELEVATEKLDDATYVCLEKLKSNGEYRAAEKQIADVKARVDASATSSDAAIIANASNSYVESLESKERLETKALEADPEVIKAKSAVNELRRKNYQHAQMLKAQQRVEALRQDQEEKEAANQEAERIANDPINKAIREHRLIRGMTYDEAKLSIGKPYALTDAGEVSSKSAYIPTNPLKICTFESYLPSCFECVLFLHLLVAVSLRLCLTNSNSASFARLCPHKRDQKTMLILFQA